MKAPMSGKELTLDSPAFANAPSNSSPHPTGRALHILLVEDQFDTAEVMTMVLRQMGYAVTQVSRVAAALSAAEASRQKTLPAGPIDLVISDLGLPDGNGLDLMRALVSKYQLRGIALSGYGMEEDQRSSRDAGFEFHLVKPVEPEDLKRAIETMLQRLPA
jgi:CheY-like chemotaxis protein